MKHEYLRIETSRDGYSEDQVVDSAMTVRGLIQLLESFNEDLPVILSFDRGYTFGTISDWDVDVDEYADEEDEEEEYEDEDEEEYEDEEED